jgi:CheY-like chemotaxis protein
MDGRMPEMDGASATRLIRAGGTDAAPVRDQELMIIALTANASEEDRSRYLAAAWTTSSPSRSTRTSCTSS